MTLLQEKVDKLRSQLIAEYHQAPGLFREMANIEALLAETYRSRALYELLQNSDDAGATHVQVDTSRPGVLKWSNDGRPFRMEDFEAICRSASSTKTRGGGSIGYRGIGFKSVAALATSVTLESNQTSLLFKRELLADALGSSLTETPLLRVPAKISKSAVNTGASFTLELADSSGSEPQLDPVALLFLRSVRTLDVTTGTGTTRYQRTREDSRVYLDFGGRRAEFHEVRDGDTALLVPMNSSAEQLTGVRGRLCCFLPLNDELGFTCIASGHVLTDPSRTHAVLTDRDTTTVLQQVGALLAKCLIDVEDPVFIRLWELLIGGEDLRSYSIAGDETVTGVILTSIKLCLGQETWPFAFTDTPIELMDVQTVFPGGAPPVIYAAETASQARSLRTALGAPVLRATELVETRDCSPLTLTTRERLASRVVETARAEGRPLHPREQLLVASCTGRSITGTDRSSSQPGGSSAPTSSDATFGGVIERWRAAEIAVMEFLNQRGWTLTDVSQQNVGYDLTGTDAEGSPVQLEVKKVESKDSRFALTNNEMAVMTGASTQYLLAVVIGDGDTAQVALLDPLKDQIPRERVCRRWEWEYSDWSRFAVVL